MEEALYDVPLYREFVGLEGDTVCLPGETTILGVRQKSLDYLEAIHVLVRRPPPSGSALLEVDKRINATI